MSIPKIKYKNGMLLSYYKSKKMQVNYNVSRVQTSHISFSVMNGAFPRSQTADVASPLFLLSLMNMCKVMCLKRA